MAVPPISQAPSGLSSEEALSYAIGQYIRAFANVETIVGTHIAYILKLDHNLIFFILKDIFVAQKIKLLRRAVEQKVGSAATETYRSVLNKIDGTLSFRNTLVHGAFIATWAAEGLLQGKLGQSLTELAAGMEPITYDSVQEQTQLLDALADDLIAAFPALPEPKPKS
jgi:hypothetical protein